MAQNPSGAPPARADHPRLWAWSAAAIAALYALVRGMLPADPLPFPTPLPQWVTALYAAGIALFAIATWCRRRIRAEQAHDQPARRGLYQLGLTTTCGIGLLAIGAFVVTRIARPADLLLLVAFASFWINRPDTRRGQ